MSAGIYPEEKTKLNEPDLNLSSERPERTQTPLLDLALLLVSGKYLLLCVTLVCALLGMTYALTAKPSFTANATIMPPQAPQSSLSALMGQLGSLASRGGGGGFLKSSSDLYVAILQSRSISDETIAHFQLQKRWKTRTMTATRGLLESHVKFEAAKDGLIHITVVDGNPTFASDLANFFIDALNRINATLAISEAAQRRLFFQGQLNEERQALTAAEEDLKRTQQKTGLLTLTGQTELAIRNIAQTRGEISAKQVALQGLRAYASDENPDVVRTRDELSALQNQLSQLENSSQQLPPGDTEIAASQVPSGSLEYARKLREVKYHDTLYELLARQYEAARIDEAKSAPIIQVVDRAVPPDLKSGPPRTLITVGSGVFGFVAACAFLFFRAALRNARKQPILAAKVAQIEEQLPWTHRKAR